MLVVMGALVIPPMAGSGHPGVPSPTARTTMGPSSPDPTVRPSGGGTSNFSLYTISDGGGPYGVAYDRPLDTIAVANDNNYTVGLYNASALTKSSEPSVERPRQIAVNEKAGLAYVADFNGYVQVLNLSTATVTKSVSDGTTSEGIAYIPQPSTIWVTGYFDDYITVLWASNYTTRAHILVGCPGTPVFDPQNSTVLVPNRCTSNVTVINVTTDQLVRNFSVGTSPVSATYDATHNVLWTGGSNGSFSAFNASTYARLATVMTPSGSYAMCVDPALGLVYGAGTNLAGSVVTVVNTTIDSVIATINLTAGTIPYDLALDTANHSVWVAEFNKGIGILTPIRWQVTFHETGLPVGTPWSVSLAGGNASSMGSTLSFALWNGQYPYAVQAKPGYTTRWVGTVSVSGANQTVEVLFQPFTYRLTFVESGLRPATVWGVVLGGRDLITNTTSLSFPEPNGTFAFTVDPVAGYASASTSPVDVSGSDRTQRVNFLAYTYPLEFLETGLPTGTHWTVTVGSYHMTSVTSSALFDVPNGTYVYAVGSVPGWTTRNYTGSVQVNGSTRAENVPWTIATFAVTFTETGLPTGTAWWVNLTLGDSTTAYVPTIVMHEPNASYSFTVATTDKTYAARGGSFAVMGGAVPQPVTFIRLTYGVWFAETGLPQGTTWWVDFNSVGRASYGIINFSAVPNGSYPFSIGAVAGFTATPSSGSLIVRGPTSFSITFTSNEHVAAPVTVLGLPPTEAYVALGGIALAGVAGIGLAALRYRNRSAAAPSDDPTVDASPEPELDPP
jgi:hypothetical protein